MLLTWYTFLYVDGLNIFRCDETPCSWTATTHWPPRSRLGFVEKNILVIVRLFSCLGRWGYFDARKSWMLQISQVITNISSGNNKKNFIIQIFCNCVVANQATIAMIVILIYYCRDVKYFGGFKRGDGSQKRISKIYNLKTSCNYEI